jgi:hypothetical protein
MTKTVLRLSVLALAAAASLFSGAANAAQLDIAPLNATCPNARVCIDFETNNWSFTTFGAYGGSFMTAEYVTRLPVSGTNTQAVKITKGAGAELWAGVTIWSEAGDKLPAIGLKPPTDAVPNGMKIPVSVYSNSVGRKIKLKIENAANGGIFVEADAYTTLANKWEVLWFDFGSPAAGTWSATETYDRMSVFPGFGTVPAVDEITYIDAITYRKFVAPPPCNSGGKQALVAGQFSSDYSATKSAECGSFGFYAGANDTLWWNGYANKVQAGGHPSQYFGFGTDPATTWGVGGFVKAPKDGYAVVNPNSTNPVEQYKGISFELWGNDELMNVHPPINVLLTSRPITLPDSTVCTPAVTTTVQVAAPGVQSYAVAFSSFSVAQSCGTTTNTTAKILLRGVTAMHAQVLKDNLYGAGGPGPVPNGLNMGKISFTY